MSGSLRINLYLRPCSIAIHEKFCLYSLHLFRLFSDLYIVQIWSINYALHFRSVKTRKRCLYWSEFYTDVYRKIFAGQ